MANQVSIYMIDARVDDFCPTSLNVRKMSIQQVSMFATFHVKNMHTSDVYKIKNKTVNGQKNSKYGLRMQCSCPPVSFYIAFQKNCGKG